MITASHRTPLLPTGTEVLAPFAAAGLVTEAGVQLAAVIARCVPGTADEVLLAAALTVRALLLGHVCLELERAPLIGATDADAVADAEGAGSSDIGDSSTDPDLSAAGLVRADALAALNWPDPAGWTAALRDSAAVALRDPATGIAATALDAAVLRPLVFDGHRVYLERYWRYERAVGDALLQRAEADGPGTAELVKIDAVLDAFFGPDDPSSPDLQRRGARVALSRRLTILAGGPGTGKTHTVARLLAAAHQLALDEGRSLEVALAAPTGKAAARMTEAVHQAVFTADWPDAVTRPLLAAEATTLHRLLGYIDGITFRHDQANPLPHDVVVVDECSMVALPLMARLLDALRPTARIVLVGDPYQLASVEAGAVLGDVVGPAARGIGTADGPLATNIVVLERARRFSADSAIAALAEAVRTGATDQAIAVLRAGDDAEIAWIDPDDARAMRALRRVVVANAAQVARAALDGDADAGLRHGLELKVLCGTRFGPLGSYAWRDHIEQRVVRVVDNLTINGRWYIGRPVIVTRNDYLTGVFNGDTGLVVSADGTPCVAMPGPDAIRYLAPSQLAEVETWWAMTVHKGQGSEFTHAVVSLPRSTSRILTRELLYTAITRGKQRVTVVATEATLRAAIDNPVARASGLADRLWSSP